MGVFVHVLAGGVGVDDFVDVGIGEAVLVLDLFELFAGIDKEDVFGGAVALEDEDGGGDAGAVEQVGGQADNGVQGVFIHDQGLADFGFGGPSEEDAVGEDDGHGAALAQVIEAVEDEGEVGLGRGGQLPEVLKPRVLQLGFGIIPLGGVGGIGHHGVKAPGTVNALGIGAVGPVPLQGIRIVQGHVVEGHAVHHQVHAGEVVGGGVELLTVIFDGARAMAAGELAAHGEQQGAGAHGGVIDAESGLVGIGTLGDNPG